MAPVWMSPEPGPDPGGVGYGLLQCGGGGGLEREGFDPHIATERQRHQSATIPAASESASAPPVTAKEKMQAKLKTPAGRAVYARRKAIVEPVIGQIKEARGFRRFLLRGLDDIGGEWRLVCLTHNLLKIWRYGRNILNGTGCGGQGRIRVRSRAKTGV